jgi:DNA-binding MarR family transcriptional regulator
MGRPDLRHHAVSHGEIRPAGDGYLHDAAMRRSLLEVGGGASIAVLEALGALRLAAKQIHDSMERFAEGHGLSESRLRVLTRLSHSPNHQLPLGELAEAMAVAPRTMTDIVDVLERDGLVKRVADPADRRSVLALITESGIRRIRAMRRDVISSEASVARGFTPEQLAQLRHLCLLLVQNLSLDQKGP